MLDREWAAADAACAGGNRGDGTPAAAARQLHAHVSAHDDGMLPASGRPRGERPDGHENIEHFAVQVGGFLRPQKACAHARLQKMQRRAAAPKVSLSHRHAEPPELRVTAWAAP